MLVKKINITTINFGFFFFFIIFAPRVNLLDLSIIIPTILIIKYLSLSNFVKVLHRYKTEMFLFSIILSYQLTVFLFNNTSIFYIVKSIKTMILLLILGIGIKVCVEKKIDVLKIIYYVFLIFLLSTILQAFVPAFHDLCILIYNTSPGHKEYRLLGLTNDWVNTGIILAFFSVLCLEYVNIYKVKAPLFFWLLNSFVAVLTSRTFYILFLISSAIQSKIIVSHFLYFLKIIFLFIILAFIGLFLIEESLMRKLTYNFDRLIYLFESFLSNQIFTRGTGKNMFSELYFPVEEVKMLFGDMNPSKGFMGFTDSRLEGSAEGDSGFLLFHSHGIVGVAFVFFVDFFLLSNILYMSKNNIYQDDYSKGLIRVFIIFMLFYYIASLKISLLYARNFFPSILIIYILHKEYISNKKKQSLI